MEIFISRDGQQFGPYPIEQVRELLNQNVLLPDDLAYHEGLDNWVSLSDIAGITEVPTIPPLPPQAPQINLVQTNERSSSPANSTQSSVAPASTGQGRMVLAFVSVLLVLVGLGSVGIWFAFFNEKQSDSDANKASLTRAAGALSPAEVETLFADDIGTWNARGFSMATGEPPQDENLELTIEWDKQGASTICKFAPLINGERVPFVGKKKYDPQAGVFIWKSKGRDFPESTSRERYDAKTKTYHGEATFPDGAKQTSTHRIINQNRRYQKSQVVKDGKVVFIREEVLTRVLDNNSNKPGLLGNILAMALPTGSGDMTAEATSESMDSEEAHDHSHDHIGPVTDSLRKSLVAYYPFNGNARNEAGNDHHGQVFGAELTADRHGRSNSAYHFKLGDHIKIDGLMGKPRNLTLSAWFKLEGPQGRLGSEIISLGDIAVLRADNNSAYAQRNGTGGVFFGGEKFWIHTMAPANYTGTGWHQIVFTFNEDLKKQVTYVDGKQMASKENPKSIVYEGGGTDTFIGVHGKTAKQNWRSQGIIDDLRVYDRALTTAEVEKLFRSEKPAFPLQAGNPIEVTSIAELRAEAQGGNPQAQFSMGLKFINGSDGLKKNPQVTEKLWLRASKQGHLIAQMNLGLLYSRGALGEKDSLKGYQWAKLSFQGGHQRAKQLAETLEKELTPEQIAEAEQFIKNFKPVVEQHGDIPAPNPSTKPESSDDDKKPGTVLWEFETGLSLVGVSSSAIGSDGTVYVGSGDNKLYAINGKTGVKSWEFETGPSLVGVNSSPAIGSDGTVYVGSGNNKLYAINGKTGVKLWEFKMGSHVRSSPAIGADGTVYVGSLNNKLYAINGKTGVKLWEFKTGDKVGASPSIGSDGTVYVGSVDDKLYAIKTNSKGLAKSPWPMRGQNAQHTGRAPKQ